MKKLFTLFIIISCLFISKDIVAQQYDSAIGLRLGFPNSVTYKKFISDVSLLEFTAGTRGFNGGFSSTVIRQYIFTGSYQIQKPLNFGDFEGLDYYYGGGLALSIWTFDDSFLFADEFSNTSFGIQGYLGLSYTFDNVPINLTLDWVPTIFLGNGTFRNGFAGFGSLGVRYVLNR